MRVKHKLRDEIGEIVETVSSLSMRGFLGVKFDNGRFAWVPLRNLSFRVPCGRRVMG